MLFLLLYDPLGPWGCASSLAAAPVYSIQDHCYSAEQGMIDRKQQMSDIQSCIYNSTASHILSSDGDVMRSIDSNMQHDAGDARL